MNYDYFGSLIQAVQKIHWSYYVWVTANIDVTDLNIYQHIYQ